MICLWEQDGGSFCGSLVVAVGLAVVGWLIGLVIGLAALDMTGEDVNNTTTCNTLGMEGWLVEWLIGWSMPSRWSFRQQQQTGQNKPWWDPWNSTGKPLLLADPNWTSIGQLPSSMHHPLG